MPGRSEKIREGALDTGDARRNQFHIRCGRQHFAPVVDQQLRVFHATTTSHSSPHVARGELKRKSASGLRPRHH